MTVVVPTRELSRVGSRTVGPGLGRIARIKQLQTPEFTLGKNLRPQRADRSGPGYN